MSGTESEKPAEKRPLKKREIAVGIAALAITLGLCVLVIVYWDYIDQAGRYGYLGVFIISIFSGGTAIVPVPGILVVFTLGSVLNPAIVGACAGLGEAIGSIFIYLTGYGGRAALKTLDHRVTNRFKKWIDRHGSITVFVMSAIINPFFFPFTAVAGVVRFGLIKFFLLCWAGKTIKGMAIAYVGYFGLGSLLRWIGIGV
jgi:membrane protein YqaA with SNARE-associated domain